MSDKYAEIYNRMHYHQQEIDKLKQQIQKLRDECDHMWAEEKGYFFTGFYCRKCGSTK